MERLRRYRSHTDLAQCGRFEGGGYRSRWYRGLAPGMEWLRLSLDGVQGARVRVYACDAPPPQWEDGLPPSLERTAADLLLYGVKGLYLCFTVEPARGLRGYELAFPGLSIDSLLPAVLQGDGTLRKLLGVYQSLYMDLNRELDAFPRRMDPQGASPLPQLPLWLGADGWAQSGADAGRLLAAAPLLNRLRGTRRGLRLLVELLTGRSCRIVERFQWSVRTHPAGELDACARLYGRGGCQVAVLLPPETPRADLNRLEAVLDDFIPLGVPWRVARLEEGAVLDGHSYLDGGARITQPPPPRLDGPGWGGLVLE